MGCSASALTSAHSDFLTAIQTPPSHESSSLTTASETALAPIPAPPPQFGPSRSLEVSSDRVKPCHAQALAFARRFAAEASSISLKRLVSRAPSMGLTAQDIYSALEYISSSAPLVIHMPEQTCRLLSNETHYKNGYETGKLRGGSREPHENALYNNSYKSTSHSAKLKYGSINVFDNPAGNPLAMGYGSCYLLMKREMRDCVTLYYQTIATPDFFAHILEAYPDNEIRNIVHVAKGGHVPHSTQLTEAHFHCDLELEACVEALHVPSSFLQDPCIDKFRARGITVKGFSGQQSRHHYY